MSPPVTPLNPQHEIIDWTEIAESTGRTTTIIEQTRARLSPEGSDRFREFFLGFIWANPPPITEAQATLYSIFANNPVLLARYSSFLTHPADTPDERDAARTEFGRLLEMPMVTVPKVIPGWTAEDLLAAIKDRLGEPALDRFIDIAAKAARDSAARIPTRPALVKQLECDEELLQRFEIIWPKEGGDYW